ncbi:MAG TPA: ABC transporter ATP-binding protein [Jatrophihabitans sp.]|jgi:ABC-2 type transport system ATP-binding protein
MTAPAIAVRGLCKDYGDLRAVDQLSFEVAVGEIFALLGPNGAGKTTTIEILEGFRERTGGAVDVLGFDPGHGGRHYREQIGIMLQSGGMDAELTVGETMRLYASLYHRPRDVDETIEVIDLVGKRSARVRTLSGGMRRRLELGLALIGDPSVVFLDEPTTGLDPSARRDAWETIGRLPKLDKTVLLTSHYMDEVEFLADRVAVLRQGSIVAEGSPSRLGGRDVATAVIRAQIPYPAWVDELPDGPWSVTEDRGDIALRTDHPTQALEILTSWAVDRGEDLVGLTVTRPSLEEAYLQITRQPKRPTSSAGGP